MTTSTEDKGVQIAVVIQGGDNVSAIDMDDSSYQSYRGCERFHWTDHIDHLYFIIQSATL